MLLSLTITLYNDKIGFKWLAYKETILHLIAEEGSFARKRTKNADREVLWFKLGKAIGYHREKEERSRFSNYRCVYSYLSKRVCPLIHPSVRSKVI